MKYFVELRAGEGGDDARLLVDLLAGAYERMFQRFG
jgi:protein subunit release factor A